MPPSITLTEDHRYLVGDKGEEWPGVTRLLEDVGLVKPYTGDEWYGERGSAVHTASHLLDIDDLDEDSIDPQIAGFIQGYRKFKADTGWSFEHLEEKLAHIIYRYCGTPDRWSKERGLDIKTGSVHEPLQLIAYDELIRANGQTPPREWFFLKLNEDGTYKLSMPYRFRRQDTALFLSAVAVWWERKKRGLL